ncbi:hypothetical protein EDB19DRAFT_2030450 [Suillus lakei]|nr:hypothetical protein EDB19DRAFT_2030450 [Suillus lakei]
MVGVAPSKVVSAVCHKLQNPPPLAVAIAIITVFVLLDFPMMTRWLTDDECWLALKRMEEDAGVGDQAETEQGGFSHSFYLTITNWKVIALSFVFYFPSLTLTLGYNPMALLLLVLPPWVYAVIFTCLWASNDAAYGQWRMEWSDDLNALVQRCHVVVGAECRHAGIMGYIQSVRHFPSMKKGLVICMVTWLFAISVIMEVRSAEEDWKW